MPIVSEETKARYELCYASILALKDIFGAKSMEDLLVKAQECRDAYDHLNAFADEPIGAYDRAPEFCTPMQNFSVGEGGDPDPFADIHGDIQDDSVSNAFTPELFKVAPDPIDFKSRICTKPGPCTGRAQDGKCRANCKCHWRE